MKKNIQRLIFISVLISILGCQSKKNEPIQETKGKTKRFTVGKIGTPSKINSEGIVFNPALELTNSAGKKILIIGMNHMGFKNFYNLVNQYIKNWVAKDNIKTVILREFFTCEGTVYDNQGYTVSQADINSIEKFKLDLAPLSFMNQNETQIQPLLDIYKMKKTTCELDVDGVTKRPSYYVRRNKDWCDQAKKNEGACQWLSFNVPDSDLIKNIEGDLKVDEWPAGMQFTASLLFDDWVSDFDWAHSMTMAIYQNPDYVVLDYRNYLLVNKTIEVLNSGTSKVVLPWGGAHVAGLVKILKYYGFTQTNLDDIKYFEPNQLGKWDLMDQGYTSEEYPWGDHYEFEDEVK